jgi:hypothetical protein
MVGSNGRLAPLAAVGAGDLGEVNVVPHQAHHKAGEMVRRNEVMHRRGQKQRLIDLPRAECLAHAPTQNLIRPSLASEIHLILGQAPRASDRADGSISLGLRSTSGFPLPLDGSFNFGGFVVAGMWSFDVVAWLS